MCVELVIIISQMFIYSKLLQFIHLIEIKKCHGISYAKDWNNVHQIMVLTSDSDSENS